MPLPGYARRLIVPGDDAVPQFRRVAEGPASGSEFQAFASARKGDGSRFAVGANEPTSTSEAGRVAYYSKHFMNGVTQVLDAADPETRTQLIGNVNDNGPSLVFTRQAYTANFAPVLAAGEVKIVRVRASSDPFLAARVHVMLNGVSLGSVDYAAGEASATKTISIVDGAFVIGDDLELVVEYLSGIGDNMTFESVFVKILWGE